MNDTYMSSQQSDATEIGNDGTPAKSDNASSNVSKNTLTRRIRVKYHNRMARTRTRVSTEIRKKYPEYTDGDIRRVADEILKDYYIIQKKAQAEETKATLLGLPFTPVPAGFTPTASKIIPHGMVTLYPESSPTKNAKSHKKQTKISPPIGVEGATSDPQAEKDILIERNTLPHDKKRVLKPTSDDLSENTPPSKMSHDTFIQDDEPASKRRRIVRPRTNGFISRETGIKSSLPTSTLQAEPNGEKYRRFPRIPDPRSLPSPSSNSDNAISTNNEDVGAKAGSPTDVVVPTPEITQPEASSEQVVDGGNNTGLFETFFKFIRKFVGRS